MATKNSVTKSFLTWCFRQQWNFLFAVPFIESKSYAETLQYFHQWVLEMETADGTLDFRWVRIEKGCRNEPVREFYVLVGGLSSTQWLHWARRWREMTGNLEGAGVKYFRDKRRSGGVRPALKLLFARQQLHFDVRIGPQAIRRKRQLKVQDAW